MSQILFDQATFRGAFLARQLERLADVIVAQGEVFLRNGGIDFPSRAVSTVLLIGEAGQITAAEIADTLEQPHQLATQRIELLIEAGIVRRVDDPSDRRRKILKLSAKGRKQCAKLQTLLQDAGKAFAALFEEIECDLSAGVERAIESLLQRPLLERVNVTEKRRQAK